MVVDALEFLVKSIVRNPDDVTVTERDSSTTPKAEGTE